jgi:capsular polysaccharide biosynthesis protein
MSLIEYVRLLYRRGWIILLTALLTAASALVFSYLQAPVYKSTVSVLVQPVRPDLGLTTSAKTLLRSYVTWINTRTNAQKVIDTLQLDRTSESLLGDVTISSDDSRFVVQIDVKNASGDLANDVAQKWADLFVQWRNDQNAIARREDQVTAAVLDPPRYDLYSPKKTINTLAGGILGLLLGGVIVFGLEYFESGVLRAPQDVERALGLSVLGAIPAGEAARRKTR